MSQHRSDRVAMFLFLLLKLLFFPNAFRHIAEEKEFMTRDVPYLEVSS